MCEDKVDAVECQESRNRDGFTVLERWDGSKREQMSSGTAQLFSVLTRDSENL